MKKKSYYVFLAWASGESMHYKSHLLAPTSHFSSRLGEGKKLFSFFMEIFIFFCSSMEGSLSYIHLTMSEDPCPILSQHIKYAFGNDKNDFAEYVHP